jgi:hypothetical protein
MSWGFVLFVRCLLLFASYDNCSLTLNKENRNERGIPVSVIVSVLIFFNAIAIASATVASSKRIRKINSWILNLLKGKEIDYSRWR